MIDGAEFEASCVIRMNEAFIDAPNVYMFYSNSSLHDSYPLVVEDTTNTKLQVTTDTLNRVITATITIKHASVKNNGTYYCVALGFDNVIKETMTTQFIQRELSDNLIC